MVYIAYLFVVILSYVACLEKYTTKYDNVDMDGILSNNRVLNSYANCLLGSGKCTPDGDELKRIIPDALQTACAKCNEKQKAGAQKVLTFLLQHKPDIYAKLEDVYDKNGVYKKKYCELAEKQGMSIKVCQE